MKICYSVCVNWMVQELMYVEAESQVEQQKAGIPGDSESDTTSSHFITRLKMCNWECTNFAPDDSESAKTNLSKKGS